MKGKYLAEIVHELYDRLNTEQYVKAEYRLSIYGRKPSEWKDLAEWLYDHKVMYSEHNRWMIQIPRVFDVFKKLDNLKNFEKFLASKKSIVFNYFRYF